MARLAFLQSQAIAPSTRRVYNTAISRFICFCTSRQRSPLPATEDLLRLFSASLTSNLAYKSIKLYLAAVRFYHVENGFHDPFTNAPQLQLLLKGIKRTLGNHTHHRFPVTMAVLRQLKNQLVSATDLCPQDKLMLWSAFTLAFFAFLRSSEFTTPTTTTTCPSSTLTRPDLSFNSEGHLILVIKASKTDPYRKGFRHLIAPSQHSVCAVRAARNYLNAASPTSAGPLYRFRDGRFLTRAQVTSTLRSLLLKAGYPSSQYSSHSFRIGAATSAAEAGLPHWLIQTLGRWSSDCYMTYIRTPLSVLKTVPSTLASIHTTGQSIWNSDNTSSKNSGNNTNSKH